MVRKNAPYGMILNLFAACSRHLAGIAAGLVTIPLVVRALGADGLGAWALLSTTGYLMMLSDLGLSVSVQRTTARRDDAATRRVIGLALLVVCIVCPCLSAGAYALLLWLPTSREALQADVARAALPILLAGLVGALANPLRGFLTMRNAFPALAWARASASMAQVVVTAVGLHLAATLVAPSLGVLAGSLLEALLLARAARRVDPGLSLRPAWPGHPAEVRDSFRQGSAALAINFSVAAAIRADVLILTTYAPLSAVGAYQVAARAVDQIAVFAKQVCAWLLHRLGNPEERASALRLGTAAMGGLVTSAILALGLDGMALLEAWAGPVARERLTLIVLALLGSAAVIAAAQEVAAATLTVGNFSAWHAARPIMLGHATNVLISLIGAKYYGAWAIAGGTVCGNLLLAFLIWSRARTLLHWRMSQLLWALTPILGAGLVSASAGWALAPFTSGRPLVSAVACGVVTLLGTGTALLIWWYRDGVASPSVMSSVAVEPSTAD
jgi:O-antigen/teichoic acid export membrane protein